jgi:hypothetical protein
MRLFGRKNTVDEVPAEVRDYYKSERRERAGVAWLLSAGTLVFTLVLAAALFFGGKWIYNHLINPDKKQETSQQANNGGQQDQNNTGNNTGTSSTNTNTPNQSGNQGNANSGATGAGAAQSSGDGSETPVEGGRGAGPTPTSLVTTGPTE